MKRFHTRAAANEGVQVPLTGPDGEPTEYWLRLIGLDSDIFRKKRIEVNRDSLLKASVKGAKKAEELLDLGDAFHAKQKLRLLACLITDWNFTDEAEPPQPLPCTEENIIAFLTEAPQIADMIDRLAADRSFFLTAHSKPSSSGPAESLTSASAPVPGLPPKEQP